jgi:hypothetical protein
MTTNSAASVVNDLRDIKPPMVIPNGLGWLWWTVGALVLATIALLAWRYFLKHVTRTVVAPPVPAHIRAKQMLERALAFIVEPKQFCTMVSDTSRIYLEERFNFRAPERTTEEFLRELKTTNLLNGEQKESLGKFLESCDLVKFAKYEPAEKELRDLHSSALRLIEETEPKIVETESGIQNPESK